MPSIENDNPQELLAEDHRALDNHLAALTAALDAGDGVTIFQRLDLFWALLAMHIRAEHLHLFPVLVSACDVSSNLQESANLDPIKTRDVVATLKDDHDFFMDQLAKAVQLMRGRSNQPTDKQAEAIDKVRGIINALTVRLRLHNQVEEELVYGLPGRILSTEDRSNLAIAIRRELENFPPRFTKARERNDE